jgi:hypothetical protein
MRYYVINYEATYIGHDRQLWSFSGSIKHPRMLTALGLRRVLNKSIHKKVSGINWLNHMSVSN